MIKPDPTLDGVDSVFGCAGSVRHLMPKMEEIPDEFKDFMSTNPYCVWQSKWFFSGLTEDEIPKTKPGIDSEQAFRHLAVIQRSFEPSHEHKKAAVAYLASLWYEKPVSKRERQPEKS